MPVSERAKQFLPFAALQGLNEALAAKEAEIEREHENPNACSEKTRFQNDLYLYTDKEKPPYS